MLYEVVIIRKAPNISIQLKILIYLILHGLLFAAIISGQAKFDSDIIPVLSIILSSAVSLTLGKWLGLVSGLSIIVLALVKTLFFEGETGTDWLRILQDPAILIRLSLLLLTGWLLGILSEHFSSTNSRFAKSIHEYKQSNHELRHEVDEYKKIIREMVVKSGYAGEQADSELQQDVRRILSLLGLSVSLASLRQKHPQDSRLDLLSYDPSYSLDLLFDQLTAIRPEVLAILDLNGRIRVYHHGMMAIFGYYDAGLLFNTSITDFLKPDDRADARTNIQNIETPVFDQDRRYQIDSADQGFTSIAISPEIKFERLGEPLSIVVYLVRQDKILSDLRNRPWIGLSAERKITFISSKLPDVIGQPTANLFRHDFKQLVTHKHVERLNQLLNSSHDGQPEQQLLELKPYDGARRIFSAQVYTTKGSNGRYLGAVLFLDNVTNEELIRERFSHRMSLEKLIIKMSTQFISIDVNHLDDAIKSVLTHIGDLEGVCESYIEIYPAEQIRQGLVCNVTNQKQLSRGLNSLDALKTLSIPIMGESGPIGQFRFVQDNFQSDWLQEDVELIRLIGEIIVNALIRKENELQIKINENRLLTTLHSIGDAVIATDKNWQIIFINRVAEQLLGCQSDDALQKPLEHVFNPLLLDRKDDDDHSLAADDGDETGLTDFQMLQSLDGAEHYISYSQAEIKDTSGIVFGHVTVFRDVTRQKLESDEIRYISYHDKLTGLYNRTFFEEELTRLNTPRQYPITIILGDCNGLKIANDVFGHLEGDKLLQNIARILKLAMRKEDIVARWGGDEFAIILPKTDEQAGAAARDRILSLCAEAECEPIKPSIALGSATNTENGVEPSDLQAVLRLAEDRMYRHKLMEGKSTRNSILQSIEKMIFEKSYETEEHARRMNEIAQKLGQAIGLNDFELEELSLLAVLHDIGKIGIPDAILQKPTRLSRDEWEIMKRHTEKGFDLAKSTPELNNISEFILHHHERWDGSGYPAGLSGTKIPKLSRILSVIDAYDVITNTRPYKKAQSKAEAIEEIKRCAGSQFDPEIVDVFIEIMTSD